MGLGKGWIILKDGRGHWGYEFCERFKTERFLCLHNMAARRESLSWPMSINNTGSSPGAPDCYMWPIYASPQAA